MTTPPIISAPWPDETLARFLTAGFGTVDVSRIEGTVYSAAVCCGCLEGHQANKFGEGCLGGREWAVERNESVAKTWAQDHAAQCRAMPKPEAVMTCGAQESSEDMHTCEICENTWPKKNGICCPLCWARAGGKDG